MNDSQRIQQKGRKGKIRGKGQSCEGELEEGCGGEKTEGVIYRLVTHKRCTKCSLKLPISSFHKHCQKPLGLSSECKECYKRRRSIYLETNGDAQIQRVAIWRDKNRLRTREYAREYASNHATEISERRKGYARPPRKPEPLKDGARSKLRYAVKVGKIKRPSSCSQCGVKCKPEAHHHDYEKPYDVIWACKKCHGKFHRKPI